MSLDRTRETVRQKSVSPYDRYPDTAVALSQLTIKPRLRANQRESECETNESEAETLSAKRKRAWVAPQRVGILCNPTQMWFILHLNTQAVNALSSRKQSSTSTSANHRLHKKNSRLLSEIPTGNAKHRPQLTYLFTPDYAGTLHTMQYGATSSGPCRGQQQRRAVSAVWVHLQLTATDGNSGFSIISHSKR